MLRSSDVRILGTTVLFYVNFYVGRLGGGGGVGH